jgi:nitrous oxidase accessory protein NosD
MIRSNLGSFFILALAMLLGTPGVAHAAESYDNCTGFITSLPAVITTEGTWCLKKDLSTAITSGVAINVSAHNVTIDCNDFKLGGLAAGMDTQTWGISEGNRHAVIVRHCNIRGFFLGVAFFGGSGHLIEDNRFDGNTDVGISVGGDGSIVRRNIVANSGKSTQNSDSYGIAVDTSVDVLDNTVSGVVARSGGNGLAVGISVAANDPDGSISGNRVRGILKDGIGQAIGIFNQSSDRLSIRGNDLIGDTSAGSVGIFCGSVPAKALTTDNVINGFATGLSGCNNDSGNVIAP